MTEGLLGDLAKLLDPESVTAVVAYLAHESCEVNGQVYSVAGSRVARIFMAESHGVVLPCPYPRGRQGQPGGDQRRGPLPGPGRR